MTKEWARTKELEWAIITNIPSKDALKGSRHVYSDVVRFKSTKSAYADIVADAIERNLLNPESSGLVIVVQTKLEQGSDPDSAWSGWIEVSPPTPRITISRQKPTA